MTTTPQPAQLSSNRPVGRVRRYFDGIFYLWRQSETRFILKLMIVLFASMLGYYGSVYFLISFFGETNFFIRLALYGDPFFLALFIFLLSELIHLYRRSVLQIATPNGQPLQPNKLRRVILVILAVFLGSIYGLFLLYELFSIPLLTIIFLVYVNFTLWFGFGYTFFLYGLLFLTGFLAAKGTLQSFEVHHLIRFEKHPISFWILFPIPWLIVIGLFTSTSTLNAFYGVLGDATLLSVYLLALIIYTFLGITSVIAALQRQWRPGLTVSQVAAHLTLTLTVLLPFLFDLLVSLTPSPMSPTSIVGPLFSLLALAFLYLQGTLDSAGDALRELHTQRQQLSPDAPSSTTVQFILTAGQKPYRQVALGLLLFLLTFYGLIIVLAPIFPILGLTAGLAQIDALLLLDANFEILGVFLGITIYTIHISFLKALKPSA